MTMRWMLGWAVTCVAALLLGGCPSDEAAAGDEPEAGSGPVTGELPKNCVVDFEHFRVGLESTADNGSFTVRIENADNIPAQKYENDWKVSLVDSEGTAMVGADIVDVEPYMPAHMHGSQTTPVITDLGDGSYQVDKIDLWMDGGWEVKFHVRVDGTVGEAIVDVCIPK